MPYKKIIETSLRSLSSQELPGPKKGPNLEPEG